MAPPLPSLFRDGFAVSALTSPSEPCKGPPLSGQTPKFLDDAHGQVWRSSHHPLRRKPRLCW